MGRAEAFAQANPPLASFWDGLTSGLGYTSVLLAIAFVRELLGFGSLFGIAVMPEGFTPWTIMVMAPSAFFLVALVMWGAKTLQAKTAKGKAPGGNAPSGNAPSGNAPAQGGAK